MAEAQQNAQEIAAHLHSAMAPIVEACNTQMDQISANQQMTLLTIQACLDGERAQPLRNVHSWESVSLQMLRNTR